MIYEIQLWVFSFLKAIPGRIGVGLEMYCCLIKTALRFLYGATPI